MAVPDFQSLMLPLLRFASDRKLHSIAEARAALAIEFKLTPEELAQQLPSGRAPLFANRLAWAKVYLSRAGLLETPQRAHFVLSEEGSKVLKSAPRRIDIKYLGRYPAFAAFRERRSDADSTSVSPRAAEQLETPEESLEQAHSKLRADLADDLLAKVCSSTPEFFERLVVELLLRMGYGGSRKEAGEAIGRSGDEGIDGTINEDRLGLDTIYIQAKKWANTVGRPEIQKFVGALHGKRAKKGVFLTTGTFSTEAREYVGHIDPKIVLIDGTQLAHFMIDYDLAVTTRATYHVKEIDFDYFGEE